MGARPAARLTADVQVLTASPLESRESASWSRAEPAVSVVIATHDRAAFVPELVAALESLEPPPGGFEVLLADDGSTDDTWPVLVASLRRTPLPALALRLPASGGPSVPRNTAAAHARGAVLALTDDDCLPERGWLLGLAAALAGGGAIVQGRTVPTDGGRRGPWDRTIVVEPLNGLWETCNLGVRRPLFLDLGGFPLLQAVSGRARGFGEDLLLGAAAARTGGAAPAPAAVVRHRWLPGSYRDHLAGRRRLEGFPRLARDVPELRERFWLRVFLTRRTAAVDAGLTGLAAAMVSRRVRPGLAAVPWLLIAVRDARARPGRSVPWRLAQVLLADVVAAASLAAGSLRHRTPVL